MPSQTSPEPADNWYEIENLLDEFEAAWNLSERPQLERYLDRIPSPDKAEHFADFLRIEFDQMLSRGEWPSLGDLLKRFPAYISQIPAVHDAAVREFRQSLIGRRLPQVARFQPIDCLGVGGQGEVWLTLDPRMARRVALKIPKSGLHDTDRELSWSMLRRESAISAKLEHPNIVPVYDVTNEMLSSEQDTRLSPCFIMRVFGDPRLHTAIEAFHARPRKKSDYSLLKALWAFERDRSRQNQTALETAWQSFPFQSDNDHDQQLSAAIESILREPSQSGTLTNAIRRLHSSGCGDSELRNLLNRYLRVCEGVAYAHSRGVIHRDLKPDNIILGEYGETLIADWGLAKITGRDIAHRAEEGQGTINVQADSSLPDHSKMGDKKGTPAYMSPEQASGFIDKLGPPSDIYSLGSILYCILTGFPPFDGKDLAEITRSDFRPPTAVVSTVPKPLEAIVLKAMSCRPEDRYPTALELAKDVERWLNDEPVSAWREPWTVSSKRWIRNHQTSVAIATVCSFLTMVAAIVWSLVTASHANAIATEQLKTKSALQIANAQKQLAEREAAAANSAREDAEQQRAQTQTAISTVLQATTDRAIRDQDSPLALTSAIERLTIVNDSPHLKEQEPLCRQQIGSMLKDLPFLQHLIPLDGTLIHAELVGQPQVLVTALQRGSVLSIRVWDIASGTPRNHGMEIGEPGWSSPSIKIDPTGTRLAVGYNKIGYDGSLSFSVRLFNLATNAPIGGEIAVDAYMEPGPLRLPGEIRAATVAFDPTGEFLIILKETSASPGDSEARSPTTIRVLRSSDLNQVDMIEVDGSVTGVSADRKANRILIAFERDDYQKNFLMLWDRKLGRDLLSDPTREPLRIAGPPTAPICLSSDGKRFTVPAGASVRLFSEDANWQDAAAISREHVIVSARFTPDNLNLLFLEQDNISPLGTNRNSHVRGYACAWDIKANRSYYEQLQLDGWVTSLHWQSDKRILTVGGSTGITRSRGGLYGLEVLPTLRHDSSIVLAALTDDSRYALVASADGLVRVWDLYRNAFGRERKPSNLEPDHVVNLIREASNSHLNGQAAPQSNSPPQSWENLANFYEPLARSPDGRWLLTRSKRSSAEQLRVGDRLSTEAFSVQIWDVIDKRQVVQVIPTGDEINRAEWSHAGNWVALISGAHPSWNPHRGETSAEFFLKLQRPKPGSVMSASVLLWNQSNNTFRRVPSPGAIGAVRFLGKGDRLLIAGSGNTPEVGELNILEAASGEKVVPSYRVEAPVVGACVDESGTSFVAQLDNVTCHVMFCTDGEMRKLASFYDEAINRTAISSCGQFVAMGYLGGGIAVYKVIQEPSTSSNVEIIWNVEQTSPTASTIVALAFTDGDQLLVACRSDGTISFLDSRTGRPRYSAIELRRQIRDIRISQDGKRLLVIGDDLGVQIVDIRAGLELTSYLSPRPLPGILHREGATVLSTPNCGSTFIHGDATFHYSFPVFAGKIEELAYRAELYIGKRRNELLPEVSRSTPGYRASEMIDGIPLASVLRYAQKRRDIPFLQLACGRAALERGDAKGSIEFLSEYIGSVVGERDFQGLALRAKAYEQLGETTLSKNDIRASNRLAIAFGTIGKAAEMLFDMVRYDPKFVIEQTVELSMRLEKEELTSLGRDIAAFNLAIADCVSHARVGKLREAISKGTTIMEAGDGPLAELLKDKPQMVILLDAFLTRLTQLSGQQSEFRERCEDMFAKLDGPLGELYGQELANLCVDNPTAIRDMPRLLESLEKQANANRGNVEFLGLLGGVQFRVGRYDDALETLTLALERLRAAETLKLNDVSEARLLLLLALINKAQGRLADAETWQKAAEPKLDSEIQEGDPKPMVLREVVLKRLHAELTGQAMKPAPTP